MSGQRTGIGRYSVIILGMLAVRCGVATLGSFLAAAGEHLTVQAVSLGSASAGFFGGGLFYSCGRSNAAVVCSTRNPLRPKRVTYNLKHPTQFHPAKAGVPPDSAQSGKREYREVYRREHSDHQG